MWQKKDKIQKVFQKNQYYKTKLNYEREQINSKNKIHVVCKGKDFILFTQKV